MSEVPTGSRPAVTDPARDASTTVDRDGRPSRAPGMIASALLLLAAAAGFTVPSILDTALWIRLLGVVLGVALIAAGTVVFARELARQAAAEG